MTAASRRAILVVDDDESMRTAVERLLNAAGMETATDASAEALLSAWPVLSAACVVSDFKLPAMSGLELLSELRSREGGPPVILITAHDSVQVRDEAKRRDAAAYLTKPFQGSALLAAIKDAARPGASI